MRLMWWGLFGEISITLPPKARARLMYSRSASIMMISSSLPKATFAIADFMPTLLPEPLTPRMKPCGF